MRKHVNIIFKCSIMLGSKVFLRKVHNQEAVKIDYRFYFAKIFYSKMQHKQNFKNKIEDWTRYVQCISLKKVNI